MTVVTPLVSVYVVKTLGLKIPCFDLVCMGCVFVEACCCGNDGDGKIHGMLIVKKKEEIEVDVQVYEEMRLMIVKQLMM